MIAVFLKPRMLMHHPCEFKSVDFLHANVHQDDSNIVAQELLHGLFRRARLWIRFSPKNTKDHLLYSAVLPAGHPPRECSPLIELHANPLERAVQSNLETVSSSGEATCEARREQLFGVHAGLRQIFRCARLQALLSDLLHNFLHDIAIMGKRRNEGFCRMTCMVS